MRKSTRITTKKQSRRRRYKTKCRRSTRRCALRRKTRKQYGASGRRTIGEAVDEMRQRLKQQDSSWYDANVVPAEERSAKRRAEIDAMNRPEAFTAPSIASMGDPEMMRKHLDTLDRAEERDNQLLKHALERSIARADAEVEADRRREEATKFTADSLIQTTRGPTPLFQFGDEIIAAEPVQPGSKFKNLFKIDDQQPKQKKRRR
jgi:hypothetical protein